MQSEEQSAFTFGVGVNPGFAVHGKLMVWLPKSTIHPPWAGSMPHGWSQKGRNSIRIQGENCLNCGGILLGRLQGNF